MESSRTWTDKNGTDHVLGIDGQTARILKQKVDIDLLACIKDLKSVNAVIEQLSDPAVLMSVCQVIEKIPDSQQDEYFSLWGGDAFESASLALLQAISDFFPLKARRTLQALINRMVAARDSLSNKAEAAALAAIDRMDFTLDSSGILTLGDGGTGVAESSEPVPSS